MIRDGNTKLRALPGEDRLDAREMDFESDQVALALVHSDEADADQQERQQERQVVVVVHRTHQHRETHQREDEPDSGGQDVRAPRAETYRLGIDALALLRPSESPT